MNPNYLQTIFVLNPIPTDWPRSFAVITAHNPNGILHSEEENRKFDSEFKSVLDEKKVRHWRVTGASQDFQHAEPGFAIAVNLEAALKYASAWQQEAIFWIESGLLFIVSYDGKQRFQLGEWTLRQHLNSTSKPQ